MAKFKPGDNVRCTLMPEARVKWIDYCKKAGKRPDGVFTVKEYSPSTDRILLKEIDPSHTLRGNSFTLAVRPTLHIQHDPAAQVGGDHYAGSIDPFSFSLAREHDCLQHSAIKYIDRHKKKNGRVDIEKAISVLHRILKEQYPE